jgi:hypothetical protein
MVGLGRVLVAVHGGVTHRTGVCVCVCVYGGVASLWVLWASPTRRNGMSRVGCMVGLGLGWLGELIPGLGVRPAAK